MSISSFAEIVVIPVKEDAVHFVFLPAIDLVDDENLVWLVLEFRGHLGVVEAFLLEVVGQVALAFLRPGPDRWFLPSKLG